ncbi:hypothetical protein JCM16138_11280 [Thermococcus atlanticus]
MAIKLEKEYYTTGEVARMLGVHYVTVFGWVQGGKIKAIQPTKRGWWRIPRAEVERLLNPEKLKN